MSIAEEPRRPGRPRKISVEPEVRDRDGNITTEPVTGNAIRGRDGEILTRRRKDSGDHDQFYIPPELIEDGWEMQWIAHSVVGNKDVVMGMNLAMLENGWRPVQADRPGFHGRYMPSDYVGHIIRDGQGLYERPKALCDEARLEDQKRAYNQMRDQNESLMGRRANLKGAMPAGFELRDSANTYRGRKTQLSMDDSLSGFAPKQNYSPADDTV